MTRGIVFKDEKGEIRMFSLATQLEVIESRIPAGRELYAAMSEEQADIVDVGEMSADGDVLISPICSMRFKGTPARVPLRKLMENDPQNFKKLLVMAVPIR